MRSTTLALIILTVSSAAFAQQGPDSQLARSMREQNVANIAFEQADVAAYTATALALNKIAQDQQGNMPRLTYDDQGQSIDCTINPKPYGQPVKTMCAFTARKAYGWYADPTLVILAKGFVNGAKVESGAKLTEQDLEVREVSITKPDPTGLE
jgi:hypothetical protein